MPKTKKETEETEVVILPEQKVEEISKDIKTFGKKAESFLAIKSQEDYNKTTAFIVEVKGRLNRMKEVIEFFTKPFQDARKKALDDMKKVEALFAPSLNSYMDMESNLKMAMSSFKMNEDRRIREEERLAREKREKEDRNGNFNPAPMPTVERVAPTVATDKGKATANKVWKFEVLQLAELRKDKAFMDSFWNATVEKGLHEQVLRNMVRAGVREVAGVRIYEDFDISVRA
jgi:hypothetical protein